MKIKERKRRRKQGGLAALPPFFRRSADQGVGIVHAPRDKGFLLLGLFLLKSHLMALDSTQQWASSRTVLNLTVDESRPVSWFVRIP